MKAAETNDMKAVPFYAHIVCVSFFLFSHRSIMLFFACIAIVVPCHFHFEYYIWEIKDWFLLRAIFRAIRIIHFGYLFCFLFVCKHSFFVIANGISSFFNWLRIHTLSFSLCVLITIHSPFRYTIFFLLFSTSLFSIQFHWTEYKTENHLKIRINGMCCVWFCIKRRAINSKTALL